MKLNFTHQISKIGILLLAFFCYSIATFAQTEGEDIIELKNGDKKRGTVIEQKPGEYIKLLQKPSNDTLQIALLDIERMIKLVEESTVINEPVTIKEDPLDKKEYNQRGYYAHISGGMGGGSFTNALVGIAFFKSVSPQVKIGLRTQYYIGSSAGQAIGSAIPVTLDVNYTFQKDKSKRFTSHFNLSTGINVLTDRNYFYKTEQVNAYQSNGLYLHPSVGFGFNFGSDFGMMIDFGLQYVRSKGFEQDSDSFLQDYNYYNGVVRATVFF